MIAPALVSSPDEYPRMLFVEAIISVVMAIPTIFLFRYVLY